MNHSSLNLRSAFLAASAGCLMLAATAHAQWTAPPSSTDALDVSQGAAVTNFTPGIAPGPDAAFGGNPGGPEPGTCFCPDVGQGNAAFIEISTNNLTLGEVRLYAKNDGVAAFFRRAMQGFRLMADTDNNGSFETTVVDAAINPDYDFEPNNLATQSEFLELEFRFVGVTARSWRAEFEQGASVPPFEGVRIIEVDGFGQAACYADCDGSGTLDIFDFLCFQNSFVSGDPYACDCDPDPACNIFDFLCFQNSFVVGCP